MVAYAPTPAQPSSPTEGTLGDRLAWQTTTVHGRSAEYGAGGVDGPAVVFLHGWALGSRAYRRAIRRLIARGCRVYAPAMPSFGGTSDLPGEHMDLAGYAEWVAAFMGEVGIEDPALVIGHSFGGGVALKLAQLHPELVRYLVLLNAVGGVVSRAPWDWVAGFGRELWPPASVFDFVQATRADLVPNLVGNPLGMMRAAVVASRADLRQESAEVRALGIPVLALTGDADSVIPRRAFEALCEAVGTDGRVISGRHSWLLADPDTFGAELGPLVDVHVTEHRSTRAATRGEEVVALMKATHVPGRVARGLVREAGPLWLMSESAAVLAGDLALCHPKLRAGEVRALARPMAGWEAIRLTVVTADRLGLLADSAAVLTAHGLRITRAAATTWTGRGLALHSFVIDGAENLDERAWDRFGDEMRSMTADRSGPAVPPVHPTQVTVHGSGGDHVMITVTAPDGNGVLAGLCRTIAEGGFSIEALSARSDEGEVRDTFLVGGEVDPAEVAGLWDLRKSGRASALRRLVLHSRPSSS